MFFNENVSWLLDTRKDAMKRISSHTYVLVREGLLTDDVGGGKGHRISADTAVVWFQNRPFRKREIGGATVE